MSETAVRYTVRVLPDLKGWQRFWGTYHEMRARYQDVLARIVDESVPYDAAMRAASVAERYERAFSSMRDELALAEAIVALAEAVQALAAGDTQTAQVIASSIIASSKPS